MITINIEYKFAVKEMKYGFSATCVDLGLTVFSKDLATLQEKIKKKIAEAVEEK